jgi:hypothetical protein
MAYRHHLLTAAAIAAVAALSLASPASAAGASSAAGGEVAKVSGASAATSVRHRLSRIANWRGQRYVRPIGPGCSSAWCGRQFVLMVGIAY